MRIGFDAKRAVQNFTGLGNYSRFVIKALSESFPENQYFLYSPHKPTAASPSSFPHEKLHFKHPKKKQIKSVWRSLGIVSDLKKDGIGIFHGLSNELPLGISKSGIKSVVTIHDLIFLRYPNYFPFIDRNIYRLKFKYACRKADKIIAVSEQTKRDLQYFFKIPEEKIEVVYQDCDVAFHRTYSPEEKNNIKKKYQLPNRFILNVGTIEQRKNLLLIAKALGEISSEVALVVVGKETEYSKTVRSFLKETKLEHRVHFLKNVPFQDLPLIYQQAEIFVYPSRFEGFGIPILEALHSGIPVIAATGSCLEEAGGPDSLYIHPDDPLHLSKIINELLADNAGRKKMAEAGLKHVKKFSKEAIASRLMNIYQALLNHD